MEKLLDKSIENPNIIYDTILNTSDYIILIVIVAICLLIPTNVDDFILGGASIKFVIG